MTPKRVPTCVRLFQPVSGVEDLQGSQIESPDRSFEVDRKLGVEGSPQEELEKAFEARLPEERDLGVGVHGQDVHPVDKLVQLRNSGVQIFNGLKK